MRPENILFKKKFLSVAPKFYWGDDTDVRYYLLKNLRKLHGCRILDIGCGVAVMLAETPNDNTKFGIDSSKESIKMAKRIEPHARYLVLDATVDNFTLPWKNSFFDVVILSNVIECIDDKHLRAVFKEIHRVLRKGGKVYLTTPNGEHFYYAGRKKTYAQIKRLFERAGFSYKIYGYNPFPLPTKLISWVPFIEDLLELCMKIDFLTDKSRYFYVEAEKKNSY